MFKSSPKTMLLLWLAVNYPYPVEFNAVALSKCPVAEDHPTVDQWSSHLVNAELAVRVAHGRYRLVQNISEIIAKVFQDNGVDQLLGPPDPETYFGMGISAHSLPQVKLPPNRRGWFGADGPGPDDRW